MPDPVAHGIRLLDRQARRPSGRACVWTVLIVALIGIAAGRFNKHEGLVPAPPGDEVAYADYVSFFRGADVKVYAATSWRPLGPFLAARLPLPPETALNTVNVAALLLSLVLIYLTSRHVGARPSAAWIACGLFAVSFPTFYYGAIGYVDPLALLFVAAGLWCLVADRWALFAAVLVPGTFAKETVALLLLPAAVRARQRFAPGRAVLLMTGCLILVLAATAAARSIIPAPRAPVFWSPSSEWIATNFERGRTWGSAVLTFGLPGLLAAWRLAGNPGLLRRPVYRVLLAGMLATLAAWSFALVSAPVDGRTMWPLYVFALPVVALWLDAHAPRIDPPPGTGPGRTRHAGPGI